MRSGSPNVNPQISLFELQGLIAYLKADKKQALAAIVRFGFFLKAFQEENSEEYDKFMSQVSLNRIWTQLSTPGDVDYNNIAKSLGEILTDPTNPEFYKKEEVEKSLFVTKREPLPTFKDNLNLCESEFGNFPYIACHAFGDPFISEHWRLLNPTQKCILAGILDGERLFIILNQQPNPLNNLDSALNYLEKEIKFKGGDKVHPHATKVLKLVREVQPKLKKADAPLFTELALRTAVGVGDPLNIKNLDRYLVITAALSERKRSFGEKLLTGVMAFSAVLLFGAMVALAHCATFGASSVVTGLFVGGAVLSGVGGAAFTGRAISCWKRRPRSIGVASEGFYRDTQRFLRDIPSPQEGYVAIDPDKNKDLNLHPEVALKMGR